MIIARISSEHDQRLSGGIKTRPEYSQERKAQQVCLGGGGLKITFPYYRRKLIATTTKASPLVEENTEGEQETLNASTDMQEKEEDPVLSRRRRPNVVLRGGYNLEYQNISYLRMGSI